jgi:hypothetical protein
MSAERIAEKAAYVRSRLEMLERIPRESFDAFEQATRGGVLARVHVETVRLD